MGDGLISGSEQLLFSLTTSRKGYIIEYVCAAVLILLPLLTSTQGHALPKNALYGVIGAGAMILMYTEISRIYTRYTITDKKIIIANGLLRQDKKNVYFHPLAFVPDINVEQNILQRLLNVGTIAVRSSEVNSFQIQNIDNPLQIAQEIEHLIELARQSGIKK